MNKSINCILIMCMSATAFILSSCNSKSSSNVDLSDIKSEISNYSFSKYDNLNFDCKPEEIVTDDIYIITAKPNTWKSSDESTAKDLKHYVDQLYNTDIDIDKMQYSYELTDEELETGEIDNTKERFNICVEYDGNPGGQLFAANNTFSASDYHEYVYGENNYPEYKALYYPDSIPNDSYNMFDGSKLTIDEAISKADGYIKTITPLLNENSSYRLKRVLIEDYPGKGTVIDLRFEHVFYGLPVNDAGFDQVRDELSFVHSPYIEVKLLGKNYLGKINNSHYDIIESKEKVEKMIPLSEAEKLASQNLAPNITGTVSEAALEYVCVTDQKEQVHTFRPMWCFTLDNYDPFFKSMELFPRRMIYVDAINGKTYYSDNKSYLFTDGKDN